MAKSINAKLGRPSKVEKHASIISELYRKHPSWSDKEIRQELKIIVNRQLKQDGLNDSQITAIIETDFPSVYTIADYRRTVLKPKQKEIAESGIDKLWHTGILRDQESGYFNQISSQAIPFIFKVQDYVEQKEFIPVSIRQAIWISYFSSFYRIPLSEDDVINLFRISAYYADREAISELSGAKVFDTTELDAALRHGELMKLIHADINGHLDDLLEGKLDSTWFLADQRQIQSLPESEKERIIIKHLQDLAKLIMDPEFNKTADLASRYREEHPDATERDIFNYLKDKQKDDE